MVARKKPEDREMTRKDTNGVWLEQSIVKSKRFLASSSIDSWLLLSVCLHGSQSKLYPTTQTFVLGRRLSVQSYMKVAGK